MLDFWDCLKTKSTPIVLYGMGNGADKIISQLNKNGIKISGIFASDGFRKKGKMFHGFEVKTLSELEKELGDFLVLMCFGSDRNEVRKNVEAISSKHEFYAPDVPVYGDTVFNGEYYEKNKENLKNVYNLLADETSKKVFENTVKYKLSGDISYLFGCETDEDEAFNSILKLGDSETYLDLGAYKGDTVKTFIKYTDNYEKIYAVEPDIKTFAKLEKETKNLKNIEYINALISDKCGMLPFCMNASRGSSADTGDTLVQALSVDSIIKDSFVSYIKADIEGSELLFISGAKETIKRLKPKMNIACYHRSEDLIAIPNAVLRINPDYKVYMRHFPSLPAWDTAYYFV